MADVSALIRQRAAENEAWRESRQEERTNLSVMRDASVQPGAIHELPALAGRQHSMQRG